MAQVPDAEWRAVLESRIDALERALRMIVEVGERQRSDVVRLDSLLGVALDQVGELRACARGAS